MSDLSNRVHRFGGTSNRLTAINALAGNAFQADIDSALAWTQTLTPKERSQVIAN
jgi:hypothetical protein